VGQLEKLIDKMRRLPPEMRYVEVEWASEALNGRTQINRYDIYCVGKMFGIKKRSNFYLKASVEGSPHQYSQELVTWLVAEYEKDDRFFVKARDKVRRT
jgi:hypothetical protein